MEGALKDGVEQVVLDARELNISAVRFVEGGKLVPAKHTLHPEHFAFGQRFEIRLPGPLDKDATAELRIDYATRPECAAAGWLGPELTVGKKHPYLQGAGRPRSVQMFSCNASSSRPVSFSKHCAPRQAPEWPALTRSVTFAPNDDE
ncbi:hypothetical protein DFJ74DRAFT_5676 [Hyaloraphidium curvatum]|nr:hypothetical protein DFJ74DRAFT_5676 [Hyaloraphidium curvatum]